MNRLFFLLVPAGFYKTLLQMPHQSLAISRSVQQVLPPIKVCVVWIRMGSSEAQFSFYPRSLVLFHETKLTRMKPNGSFSFPHGGLLLVFPCGRSYHRHLLSEYKQESVLYTPVPFHVG